jgi:hypothetical protein
MKYPGAIPAILAALYSSLALAMTSRQLAGKNKDKALESL